MIKLNICAGPNVFPCDGWINYDRDGNTVYFNHLNTVANEMTAYAGNFHPGLQQALSQMPEHQLRVVNYIKSGGKINNQIHDIRNPFTQHPDGTIDCIYVGQAIEHFNPIYETPPFLKECYRMLKPGGVLRMTTPDFELIINTYMNGQMDKFSPEQPDFYKNALPEEQLSYLMFGACGPSCSWSNYEGHMFLFTKDSMTKALLAAGFSNPVFYQETGQSLHPVMQKEVVDAGMSHSFIVEVAK